MSDLIKCKPKDFPEVTVLTDSGLAWKRYFNESSPDILLMAELGYPHYIRLCYQDNGTYDIECLVGESGETEHSSNCYTVSNDGKAVTTEDLGWAMAWVEAMVIWLKNSQPNPRDYGLFWD